MVVSTGTRPAVPPVPGLAEVPYWTNRQALEAKELPSSLVVLGAGAVGLELAQAFARFGVRVSVVEVAGRLLPAEEPEAGELVADVLRGEAVDVRVGAGASEVRRDGRRYAVSLADGDVVTGEQVLVATGRRVDVAGLGLDTVGVAADAAAVPVGENLRVNEGVWAVGDVTGKGAFTHMAVYQAGIAAADILGGPHQRADYRAVPRVTFTDPEVRAVGLTEAAARAAGISVRVGRAGVPASASGWIHKVGNEGFVKLVADGESGLLVGATSVGPAGGRSPRPARPRRARPGARRPHAGGDLRLSHLPSSRGGRPLGPRLTAAIARPVSEESLPTARAPVGTRRAESCSVIKRKDTSP